MEERGQWSSLRCFIMLQCVSWRICSGKQQACTLLPKTALRELGCIFGRGALPSLMTKGWGPVQSSPVFPTKSLITSPFGENVAVLVVWSAGFLVLSSWADSNHYIIDVQICSCIARVCRAPVPVSLTYPPPQVLAQPPRGLLVWKVPPRFLTTPASFKSPWEQNFFKGLFKCLSPSSNEI